MPSESRIGRPYCDRRIANPGNGGFAAGVMPDVMAEDSTKLILVRIVAKFLTFG